MSKPKPFAVIVNTKHKKNKGHILPVEPVRRHRRKECPICRNPCDFFGVGPCFHPICMECSIRLRIIGQSKVCPQCREEIETLYIVSVAASQTAFVLPESIFKCQQGADYGIKFANEDAIKLFNDYTAHKCSRCEGADVFSFPTFAALHQHAANVHGLSFCYLCTENINMLSKDRKLYSRPDLQKHMDGTFREVGFQGHPKCLFCDLRFYDKEEQFKHLRKDHFYCAICEEGGVQDNSFYRNRGSLSHHYRLRHYPCPYAECKEIPIAFRTQDELTIHRAREHHEKSLKLDFLFTTTLSDFGRNRSRRGAVDQGQAAVASNVIGVTSSAQMSLQPSRIVPSSFNPTTDFPSLPGVSRHLLPLSNTLQELPSSGGIHNGPQVSLTSSQQFPSLPSGPIKQASTSIWAKGNTGDLFKEKPQAKSKPTTAPPKRKLLIDQEKITTASLPESDVWTEEMRRKREEQLKQIHGQENEQSKKVESKKSKLKKKEKFKTIPIGASTKKCSDRIPATQSIFQSLYSLNDPSQISGGGKVSK